MSSLYAAREGVILVKAEATYGTDPTPSVASNARYVEEVNLFGKRVSISRNGPSPYAQGFMPVVGPAECGFSVKFELVPITVADTAADRPLETDFLKAGGRKPTGSGTDPKLVTYAMQSNPRGTTTGQESSVTLYGYKFNADDDDGWLTKVHGCRGNETLEIDGENRWFMTVEGPGASYSHTAIGASRATTGLPDYDFDTAPVVGGSGVVLLKAITANETYPATGRVVSFKQSRSGAALKRGIGGQYVSQLTEPLTAELVIAVTDAGDFDPWQYQGQNGAAVALPDAILVQIANTDLSFNASGVPSDAGNYIMHRAHYYITDVEAGDDGGEMTWTLSLVAAYDIDSNLAGEKPGEDLSSLIYGTKA